MKKSCFVCNAQGAAIKNCVVNVSADYQRLPVSGSKLLDIICEIVDTKVEVINTDIMCRKCYKACVDYDSYKFKTTQIKMEMVNNYKTTQATKPIESPVKKTTTTNRIIVPASKLQPLPPNFQLNFTKFTVGNTVNTNGTEDKNKAPSLPASVNKNLQAIIKIETDDQTKQPTEITQNNDITKWSNTLPKDIFSTLENENLDSNENLDGNESQGQDGNDSWTRNDENNDENDAGMEIDEESDMAILTSTSTSSDVMYNNTNIKNETTEVSDNLIDNNDSILDEVNNENFVFGKIRILNNESEEQPHTIVVDGENASILEMVRGQKLIYENGEISFVMADDGTNDDNNDDSNDEDESQIELQMSGDEETANAIIAAAQEQEKFLKRTARNYLDGILCTVRSVSCLESVTKCGAFIKVESGEMYQVKSVQSKTADCIEDVMQIVDKKGDQFTCLLCEKLQESNGIAKKGYTADAENIMVHLKSEHDATIYICHLCGLIVRKRTEYFTHLAEHTKVKLYDCDICKRNYNSRTLLQEHMNTHTGKRPYTCHICHKSFASKYTHQSHLKIHEDRPRPYKCNQCGKSFLSQQNLNQHEKTHLGIKNFVCKICNKAFGTQHNLEVHGVVHSGEREHSCRHCGKAFARRAELLDHVRTHTGERPFSCNICGARFSQRSNLHSHRRATHLNDRRHACTHCSKRFKRRRLLEYHIKASHTGERPLKCEVCSATFVYPEHFKKHVKIHTGEKCFFCEICGKSFNSRDNRNTHRFVHSDKKPYECLTCGASFMRKRLLIAHMTSSGHLAESIVVNQPRVTRFNDDGIAAVVYLNDNVQVKPDDDEEEEKEQQSEIKLLDEAINNDNLQIQENNEIVPSKFIISPDDLKMASDNDSFIQTLSASQLVSTNTNTITDDSVLRLIQVKLPDGKDGWVAIND